MQCYLGSSSVNSAKGSNYQQSFDQPGPFQLSIPTTRYSSGHPAMGGWFLRRRPRSLSPHTRASVIESLELGLAER
jgi:hypothetical protein